MNAMPDASETSLAAKDRLRAEIERRQRRKQESVAIARSDAARHPLSYAQQRLWFLHRLEGASPAYNIVTGLRLRGACDIAALHASLARLARRHAVLRSVIVEEGGEAWQDLREDVAPALRSIDLSALQGDAQDTAVAAHKQSESAHAFALERECLLRALLLRLRDDEHVLLLTIHHIVADGWSVNVLLGELLAGYQAARDGEDEAPPLPIQYGDYARWQREQSDAQQRDIAYWQTQLQGAPGLLQLPADHQRPAQASYRGGIVRTHIDADLRRRAEALARQHDASLFMLLLAAFGSLLARHAGQRDVVVGTPLANRERAETAGLIGFFVSSLPLRLRAQPGGSFLQLLAATRSTVLDALQHQSVPFERLVDVLRPERSLAYAPVFQVMFGLNNTAATPLAMDLPGLGVSLEDMPGAGAKFDLSVSYSDHGGALDGYWEFASDLFDAASVAALGERYDLLLRALVDAPASPLDGIVLATAAERARTRDWSRGARHDVAAAHPAACIAAHAARAPHALAVVATDGSLSYGTFERRANQLAHELIARGVMPEERVALVLQRGVELPLAMLAVIKAGACYVPLDPALPLARRRLLIAASGARLVISDDPEHADALRCRDLLDAAAARPGTPPRALHDAGLIYVIYTSGTSGMPKGVAVQAASLANLAQWHAREFGLDSGVRATQLAGTGFDAMAWEAWPHWMSGACLVLPDAQVMLQPAALAQALDEHAVSHCFLPTPVAEASFPALAQARSLRVLLVGGDQLAPVAALPAGIRLVNNYGPTESTVVSTSGDVMVGSARMPDIGRPIANLSAYVLDPALQPLPPGVLGELYVGGAGVARGYLHEPAQTAQRFLPDPFADAPGARLYRTGDLARWRRDGSLEFAGRADEQVKLRGHRIEIAEIESHLLRIPGVIQACVQLCTHGSGEQQLVAYLAGDALPPAAPLRDALRRELPDYMVPALFVSLDSLPLTANGKVDRRALPQPDWSLRQNGAGVEPVGELETAVAAIWAGLLRLERVGRHDNFFELGGHSMLAARLLDVLREHFGVAPALKLLWTNPTVAELAARLAEALQGTPSHGGSDALPQIAHDAATRHEPFVLTDIQQAYWLGRADVYEIGNVAAHAYSELELRADTVLIEPFEHAFNQLLRRHDMLRMVVDGEGRQRVLADPGPYRVAYRDLRSLDAAAREQELLATREAMSHQVFATDRWPLFDVRLSRLDENAYRLYWSFDGLLFDGFSQQILIGELTTLLARPQAPLPAMDITFRDYVRGLEILRGTPIYQRSQRYWLARLPHFPAAPELTLAADPATIRQPRFVRREFRLPAKNWNHLRQQARQRGLTAAGLLLTAFSEVLAAWSRSTRFTLNLTLFNRLPLHAHVDRLLGDFTSLTLLAVDHDLGADFGARCQRLQQQLWDDIEHRHFGGLDFLRELRRSHGGDRARMPVVFSSMLDMGAAPQAEAPADEGMSAKRGFAVSQTSQVWLDHQVSEDAGELVTAWDAVEQLFPAAMLDAMFAAYTQLLMRLGTDETVWSAQRVVGLPAAQAAVREAVNATAAPWSGRLLQQGFEEQVLRTPDALAVWSTQRELSYAQLRHLARYYAQQLRAAGVKPNQLVGVVMHKGWEQVVAVLAILHAGGAYLPIDAGLPASRIEQLLALGDVALVLTQAGPDAQLPWPATVLRWVVRDAALSDAEADALEPVQDIHNLAYVIFTSGSTGQPKGVMIDHRGATNTVESINALYRVGSADRVLALSSLSFDLSVYDIFGLLAVGGAVVLPDAALEKDPAHWSELLGRAAVTLWNSVPALLQLLVEQHEQQAVPLPAALREVMLSGDWIPVGLPGRLRALAPAANVTSMGGATEASIWSIYYPIGAVDPAWRSIPYGRPLANQSYHVLKPDLGDCPDGVAGDLYIGGIGLAQGYWRDPVKTATSFVFHPHSGERLYRTGDRGCYFADGDIEFLGREDNQVKIQGYRVELGEIEAALLRQPGVSESVVVAQGEPGKPRRLVGYVVLDTATAPDPRAQAALERTLFKLERPGLRRLDGERNTFALATQPGLELAWQTSDAAQPARAVDAAALGRWLCALRGTALDAAPLPKFFYPSSGSLNPIQAYLQIGEGALTGIAAGSWYYDPQAHALRHLGDATVAAGELQLHLVAALDAVTPLYGESALALCEVEAGYVAETLRLASAAQGIVLHATVALPMLADALQLGEAHRVQSSFVLNGAPAQAATQALAVLDRQSYRRYADRPLQRGQLDALLDSLQDEPGLAWYLHVKPDRVETLDAGYYRYWPSRRALELVRADSELPLRRYGGGSAATFEQAAVAIYALGDTSTEVRAAAGAQSQRLSLAGVRNGIGVCPIGGFNEAGLARQLGLGENTTAVVVHSVLAGAIDAQQRERWEQETAAPPAATPVERLRRALAETLPAYMVPAALLVLDTLPLTANGKVDRKALPAAQDLPVSTRPATAPVTTLQTQILAIWKEVLGTDAIGIDDHFFESGGDSLKVVQVQTRLRAQLKSDINLRELYANPTVALLETVMAPRLQHTTAAPLSSIKAIARQERRREKLSTLSDAEIRHLLAQRRATKDHADEH